MTLTSEYKQKRADLTNDYLARLADCYIKDGLTLEEIGAREGLTRERIRQLLFKKKVTAAQSGRKLSRCAAQEKNRVAQKHAAAFRKWGCSLEEANKVLGGHLDSGSNHIARSFLEHRQNARRKYAKWEISLPQYAALLDGRVHQIGRRGDLLVLVRKDKSKPYTADNVELVTLAESSRRTDGLGTARAKQQQKMFQWAQKALSLQERGHSIQQIARAMRKGVHTVNVYLAIAKNA